MHVRGGKQLVFNAPLERAPNAVNLRVDVGAGIPGLYHFLPQGFQFFGSDSVRWFWAVGFAQHPQGKLAICKLAVVGATVGVVSSGESPVVFRQIGDRATCPGWNLTGCWRVSRRRFSTCFPRVKAFLCTVTVGPRTTEVQDLSVSFCPLASTVPIHLARHSCWRPKPLGRGGVHDGFYLGQVVGLRLQEKG